ncbi:MAG TPA: HAMP domain-containing sensor histidine kinase [Acidimicrobiia bacterium]|nr:HAMP domain-containing sensor histidine kinase [Acidimicrobiia bacterium]
MGGRAVDDTGARSGAERRIRPKEPSHAGTVDAMRGWSSFENLFRISPIPIMEQDYSELVEWMDGLRAEGVSDLRDYLGDDIEAIRAIVPMIRIVAANPAAVAVVGLPLDELIGPIDPMIVNVGAEKGWLTQLEAVWNGEPEAHAAYTASTFDGQTYDAESILAAPVIDGEPDFSRAVLTLIDVTSHRNEERRMSDLVRAKNQFLASVSHEIRTPLTAILGFSRILEDDPTLEEDDRRLMVASIVQHSQEVADLVEDLLVAARADMGQIEVANTTFDVVTQIATTLRAGGSFTTDVTVESGPAPIRALGDPTRLRQIVRNLLTNAERYGGSVVTIHISKVDNRVLVAVADDGPGLPRHEWDKVFEPYHRGHQTPGRPGSVGIGLAISRQLAELMGGTLTYTRGQRRSVFLLTLRAGRD